MKIPAETRRITVSGSRWPKTMPTMIPRLSATEQRGDSAGAVEIRFYRQLFKFLGDVNAQHVHSPRRRSTARRANHSEATSAANAIKSEITISCSAAKSPFGVWIRA